MAERVQLLFPVKVAGETIRELHVRSATSADRDHFPSGLLDIEAGLLLSAMLCGVSEEVIYALAEADLERVGSVVDRASASVF